MVLKMEIGVVMVVSVGRRAKNVRSVVVLNLSP